MAAMQRVPVLQQQSSSSPGVGIDSRKFWSLSSAQAFRFGVSVSGCCISLSSLAARSPTPGRGGSWLAKAGGEEGVDSTQNVGDKSGATSVASPGEPKLGGGSGGGAKGFGASPKGSSITDKNKSSSKSSSGGVRRTPPTKPLIGVSPVDQQTQRVETAVVASLAFLLAVVFLEGLILAVSGLLPDEWDEFAASSIYPAFTPSVGVFLAIAASYGLWKSLGGGTGQSGR